MEDEAHKSDSRYRLQWRGRGVYTFYDGERSINVGCTTNYTAGWHENILFAPSLRHWNSPHQDEPITDLDREQILTQIKAILEAEWARAVETKGKRMRVKFAWRPSDLD